MANYIGAAAKAAMDFTRDITTRYPDRLTGSAACTAAADEIQQQMSTFCNQTFSQDFQTHPGSFLGFIRLAAGLYFISLGCFFLGLYAAAAVIGWFIIGITVLQFFLYKELTDRIYPARQSRNVWGVIEPVGEVRQQIIISAHHDSAHVFNFLEHFPRYYHLIVNLGLGIVFLYILIATIIFATAWGGTVPASVITGAKWTFPVLSIAVLPLWFFFRDQGTPGAGDNMICVATALETGKFFSTQDNRLQHTQLIIASWDAEECGLRGARAFIKEHGTSLKAKPVYNLNYECFYDMKDLSLLTSDLNGFVQLSADMAGECVNIGRQLGYSIKAVPFPLLAGGTDAAEFAKAGIPATTLQGMSFADKGELPAYHTTRDTIDRVSREVTAAALEITIAYVADKDAALK